MCALLGIPGNQRASFVSFAVTQTYEEDISDYGGNYLYTETEATESTTLRPFIDPSTPTNVTVIKGKTAMLACVVRNVGKAAVSRVLRPSE